MLQASPSYDKPLDSGRIETQDLYRTHDEYAYSSEFYTDKFYDIWYKQMDGTNLEKIARILLS